MRTLRDIEREQIQEHNVCMYFYTGTDSLREIARENIKIIEKEMEELDEMEREQYLFLAGKRHMYIEFFGVNGDIQ